jgi:hypothetical protein
MEKTALDRSRKLHEFRNLRTSNDLHQGIALDDFFRQQQVQRIQRFTIRGEKDQMIRGNGGVELRIPALSFIDSPFGVAAVGEITLELIELLDTTDMMLTKRPTTSGGQLLETGGAFAFSARQYNQPLQQAKPITARVPVSERTTRPDLMSAFAGPLRSPGRFDWSPSFSDAVTNPGQSREQGYYELNLTRPQWINCDYFYRRSRGNMEFAEISAAPEFSFPQQNAFLLFKDINAVAMMWPSGTTGQLSFRAPKGHDALIAMIGVKGEDFFFGASEINTSEGPYFTLPLELTPREEMKDRLSMITG